MENNQHTASILVIGNEILSGRTQDRHVQFIAKDLSEIGVELREVAIIPDEEDIIIERLNHFRKKYDYVFTTGGIGPTHDDITAASIAKAFGVKLKRSEKAAKMIKHRYKEQDAHLNEDVFKMADIPENGELIINNISGAPGFRVENVFVFAGVPSVMKSMFKDAKTIICSSNGKQQIISNTFTIFVGESRVAKILRELQIAFPNLQIGSYPFMKNRKWCSHIVVRGVNERDIQEASNKLKECFYNNKIEFKVE